MQQITNKQRVAIIGGGPGALAAARYLKKHGFVPAIFEASDSIGGQWNARNANSGVWTGLCTNTSKVMTSFSDLAHEESTPAYPSHQQMHEYLLRYVEKFELDQHILLNTKVERIERRKDGVGYIVRSISPDGGFYAERFDKVIIATGRYNRPATPQTPELESFTGSIRHSFQYKDVKQYSGQKVLVAGGSISALEIASQLAMGGAEKVISTTRRQRYIFQKLLAGVPTDHRAFTRFAGLAGESFPPEALAAGLKDFILKTCGDPEQYGAMKPAENVFEAGISQSQYFLPLVAEGRITQKPWIQRVEGNTVHFADGSSEAVDTIIFGTGFKLNLPFLSEDIQQTLNLDEQHVDLHHHTFHLELPGLAFLGLFDLVGPVFPVLELQARWITYCWAGVTRLPMDAEMQMGVAAYQARRGTSQAVPMHALALLFARLAGCEPDPSTWPELARGLMFGPLAATGFRLSGPDALPDAAERFAHDAAAFGTIPSPRFADEECAQLDALSSFSGNDSYRSLIGKK